MKLKIKSGSKYIQLQSDGVKFRDGEFFGHTHAFNFDEIDCVLMSEDNVLSFQVKQEVFSIPTKPNNLKNKQVIDKFIQEVKRSASTLGGEKRKN
jgi:hypothetical protein